MGLDLLVVSSDFESPLHVTLYTLSWAAMAALLTIYHLEQDDLFKQQPHLFQLKIS